MSSGPPNIGEEVPPGNGRKCMDTGSAAPAQNVRTGTNLLSKGRNLFGQGLKFTKNLKYIPRYA